MPKMQNSKNCPLRGRAFARVSISIFAKGFHSMVAPVLRITAKFSQLLPASRNS